MVRGIRAGVVLCALGVVAACGGSESTTQQATSGTPPPPAAGNVTGRIHFAGTPPTPRTIRMASDPNCLRYGQTIESEVVVVGPDGGLQNVFVYVKDGLGDWSFPVPSAPAVLDQDGCRYEPRVLGVQVNQPLEIVNSDPTFHNVNARPRENTEFNFGQHTAGQRDTRTFTRQEVMVPFRCDVHGWMIAYVGVVPHPFFAVTGADGQFTLEGLPAGTYTIEAWHEQLGTQTQTVTVAEGESPVVQFTFAEQG
jgi:plastocyanin